MAGADAAHARTGRRERRADLARGARRAVATQPRALPGARARAHAGETGPTMRARSTVARVAERAARWPREAIEASVAREVARLARGDVAPSRVERIADLLGRHAARRRQRDARVASVAGVERFTRVAVRGLRGVRTRVPVRGVASVGVSLAAAIATVNVTGVVSVPSVTVTVNVAMVSVVTPLIADWFGTNVYSPVAFVTVSVP